MLSLVSIVITKFHGIRSIEDGKWSCRIIGICITVVIILLLLYRLLGDWMLMTSCDVAPVEMVTCLVGIFHHHQLQIITQKKHSKPLDLEASLSTDLAATVMWIIDTDSSDITRIDVADIAVEKGITPVESAEVAHARINDAGNDKLHSYMGATVRPFVHCLIYFDIF